MRHQANQQMAPAESPDEHTPLVQLLFAQTAEPAWIVDQATGALLVANPAAIQRYGYSQAEFLELTLDDLCEPRPIDPNDPTAVPALQHRTHAGQLLDVELTECAVLFQGSPARLVLARDISVQLRTAEQRSRGAARATLLQAVTAALAETLTPAQVADVVLDHTIAVLGAYAGGLAMLTDDHATLQVINAIGYASDLLNPFQRIAADADVPLAETTRTSQPILLGSREEINKRYPLLGASSLGTHTGALASIPLIAGGRTIGALGLSFSTAREFDAEEQAFMLALARQCAQALDRAQLYAAERQAHATAEAARQRESFLAEAGVLLAASLDYQDTLKSLARIAVPVLADLCTIHMLTECGSIEQIAVAHRNQAVEPLVWMLNQRYAMPPEARHGLPEVIRSGQPAIFPEVRDIHWGRDTNDDAYLDLLQQLQVCSLVCLPLIARGRTLGALTCMMTDDSSRRYTPDSLHTAEELARRAALAIDNARLYQAAQQAAQLEEQHASQLRRLSEASLAINSVRALDAMLHTITSQARTLLGAHYAATTLLADEGWSTATTTVESDVRYATLHDQPWQPHAGGVYAEVCSSNAPLRLSRVEWASRQTQPNDTMAHSWLGAPLIRRDGHTMGLIALFDKAGGDFSAEDEAILVQLAQLAAVALENVRLYDEAQAAIRARNEVLSLVSHDLKNPLGVIKGYAQHLQRRAARMALPDLNRLTDGMIKIEAAADKMAVLIGEFLDVARLQTGDLLDLDRGPVDLAALVTQAVTEHQQAGNHQFQLQLDAESLTIAGDAARLERVLDNLLSNASKYSPADSLITVGLTRATPPDDAVVLTVADQGIGIPPADLPYIFERFRRASNVTGHIRGTGIGLASARQIVEQHGGTISVVSVEGRGSIFTVQLPRIPLGR